MNIFEIFSGILITAAAFFAFKCWCLFGVLKSSLDIAEVETAADTLDDHLSLEDSALLRAALAESYRQGQQVAYEQVRMVLTRNFTNIEEYVESNIKLQVSSEESFENNFQVESPKLAQFEDSAKMIPA